MKKILVLLFSLLISFNSYGEWTRIINNIEGDVIYVDNQTIKSVSNMRYYYQLLDYVSPTEFGDLSDTAYKQIDCKTYKGKLLSVNYYSEPLGRGNPTEGSGPRPNSKWKSYPINSIAYESAKYACNFKR